MDLDDFEEQDAPKEAPAKAPKFAPKVSKFKPQPKGKKPVRQEVSVTKSELPEPIAEVSVTKPEPQEPIASALSKEEDEDMKPKLDVEAKVPVESSVSDAARVNMEVDATREAGGEDDHMDIDNGEEVVEEEDVIVREIEVFFTPSVDPETQLYVLQYPLRPRWRPYELDERCEEVRVKPSTDEVEVDLSIDDSMNFDANYASMLEMKKQTLSSVWAPPSTRAGYAVGVLIGNKLHLNPVKAVVQLRPSMKHLSSDSKLKTRTESDADVTIKQEGSSQSKRASSSKTQTGTVNVQASDAEESWVPLKYHNPKSDISSAYLEKMATQNLSPIDFTMSPYDYMSSMCVGASNSSDKRKGPSRRVLLSLPLKKRIEKLLLEGAPVQKFVSIKHFAPDSSSEDLLEALGECGQLVQGLWVAKTALVIPSSDGQKRVARDFVLLLFSKSIEIRSSILKSYSKMETHMKDFLKIFAVERPSLGDWKFKEQTDWSFMKQYPHVVEKFKKSYESVERSLDGVLSKMIKVGPGGRSAAKPNVTKNPAKPLGSDKTATTTTASGSTKGTITHETREGLKKFLLKIFQTHKVCSFQFLCQNLRDQAISQSTLPKTDPRIAKLIAAAADGPQEELEEVINEVANKIHGFYVLKSSPDHPEHDSIRRIVINLLIGKGPNAKLKKAEIKEAVFLELKREMSNAEYKVVADICESKGSAWVLKSGDGKPT
ncbi:DNA-directed RNA polymerase III subunit RPC5 [Linum grandiflorum]